MALAVGFIGLGNMGRPMALNLVKHGFPLVVHDIDPAKVEPLRARGAAVAESAAPRRRSRGAATCSKPWARRFFTWAGWARGWR